jgi:2'-5' RNA ligase
MRELPDRLRAFLAVPLDADAVSAIEDFVKLLQTQIAGVSWVKRDNLHVTLRFLGDAVAAEQILQLDHALGQIGTAIPRFTLEARGVGVFPNLERPRVVWIGLHSDVLASLARRVEDVARESGFPQEPRSYTPPLTIGRVRDRRQWVPLRDSLAQAAERDFGSSKVDSMMLYRSILGSGAATYQELARYSLGLAA